MSISFLHILEAKESGDLGKLNEASLNRVLNHTTKGNFGILTSWRGGNTPVVNAANFNKLQAMLRAKGLGFFKLKGQWPECQDPNIPYDKCPPDMIKVSSEPSLFVPGISKELLTKLMFHFTQDGVMYSGPETNNKVIFIKNDGSESPAGNINPNTISTAFSSVKGRPFTFEYVAQTWSERLMETLFKLK